MGTTYMTSVIHLSKKDNMMVAYYLYNVSIVYDALVHITECHQLYLALVTALQLEDQAEIVSKKILQEYYEEKNKVPRVIKGILFSKNRGKRLNSLYLTNKELFFILVMSTFFNQDMNSKKVIQKQIDMELKKVSFVTETFNLTINESRLLTAIYYNYIVRELHMVFNSFKVNDDERITAFYGNCLNLREKDISKMLSKTAPLRQSGLIYYDGDIPDKVIEYIDTKNIHKLFSNLLLSDKQQTYPLNSFSISDEETNLTVKLLSSDSYTNILLYGTPGSGKTEYARSLVKKAGLQALVFKNALETEDLYHGSAGNSVCQKLYTLLGIENKESVIIIDEAEAILNTKETFSLLFSENRTTSKKGTINTMLANSKNKVIWILNYTNGVDESTLRRFTYSLHFNKMPKTILNSIANSKLLKIGLNETLHSGLVDLCGKYHVTGSSVDNMVKIVESMDVSSCNESVVLENVKCVLESNSTLLYGKSKMREKVRDSYDISILNTSVSAEEIVEMTKTAIAYAEENQDETAGIRMLFYGLSGTGKTELARYIADCCNKSILLKRASDIMGKYVGENEENIKNSFAEAEVSGDILLFDEADSCFADRSTAPTSWQRSMVNEFLTQMEEFSGILICTTNLRQIMDPAMERRFHIMSEFKSLSKSGVEVLLHKFFPKFAFSEDHISTLSKYNSVTPGDFGALCGKLRFVKPEKISSELIISDLCDIQEEKQENKSIGFGC